MNCTKIWKFIQLIAIFIIIICILFIQGINQNAFELLGTVGSSRISIEARENFIDNEDNGFTQNEIIQLTNKLKNNETLFAIPFETNVKTNSNTILLNALATNSSYRSFSNIHIINGSFLTKKQEENKEKTSVIEQETALKLFKSTDIVGMNIKIMNEDFKIVGISKTRNSFLSKLCKRKEPQIYIPLQAAFTLNKDITIPCLQISTLNKNKEIYNQKTVTNTLEYLGKSVSNYKIIDYRTFKKQTSQIIPLITFIFGLLIIFYLLKVQIKLIKKMCLIIKEKCSLEYFLQSLKLSKKILVYLVLELLFCAACIYIIIKVIKFDFYINYENSNLFHGYLSIFKDNIFEIGSSKLFLNCIIKFSQLLINLIAFLGIPLGFILLFVSFYFLKHCHFSLDKTLLFFSTSYILSLLISPIIVNTFKLPVIINTKSVIVIFIFIFLKNMLIIGNSK